MSQKASPECDHCGACCKGTLVEIQHLDVVREPKLLRAASPCKAPLGDAIPDDPWERVYILSGASGCPMHADGRCSIYPTRPNVCVAFEAGSPDCQRARYHAGLTPLGLDQWPRSLEDLDLLIYGEEES